MRKYLLSLFLLCAWVYHPLAKAQYAPGVVNCATSTPCTLTGPVNNVTGDPFYSAFGKYNTAIKQLYGMFGLTSNFYITGTLTALDIVNVFSGCTGNSPTLSLGADGACHTGSGGGAAGNPGGVNGQIQYNNNGVFGGLSLNGTGNPAGTTGPVFVTPTIGVATVTSLNGNTLPAVSGDVFVMAATTQTLTNKSISASEINSGTFAAAQIPAALTSTTSVNGTSIPASATLAQTIASGTASLGTGAIASGTCATGVTVTATGTTTTDAPMVSFNSDPTAVTGYAPNTNGNLTIYPYPTSNTMNFKVCNSTGSSITPGALTLNWRVVR